MSKGQKVWESGFRVQGSAVEKKSLFGLIAFIEMSKVDIFQIDNRHSKIDN